MRVAYVAHPISGDVPGNLAKIRAWISRMQPQHPDLAFIAPYVTWLECGDDDSDPVSRNLGMDRDLEVLRRCDEIWLIGSQLSPGMWIECQEAKRHGIRVVDCIDFHQDQAA